MSSSECKKFTALSTQGEGEPERFCFFLPFLSLSFFSLFPLPIFFLSKKRVPANIPSSRPKGAGSVSLPFSLSSTLCEAPPGSPSCCWRERGDPHFLPRPWISFCSFGNARRQAAGHLLLSFSFFICFSLSFPLNRPPVRSIRFNARHIGCGANRSTDSCSWAEKGDDRVVPSLFRDPLSLSPSLPLGCILGVSGAPPPACPCAWPSFHRHFTFRWLSLSFSKSVEERVPAGRGVVDGIPMRMGARRRALVRWGPYSGAPRALFCVDVPRVPSAWRSLNVCGPPAIPPFSCLRFLRVLRLFTGLRTFRAAVSLILLSFFMSAFWPWRSGRRDTPGLLGLEGVFCGRCWGGSWTSSRIFATP